MKNAKNESAANGAKNGANGGSSHASAAVVGIVAMAAAAAGAYFLYGSKDAEKNRKLVKSWMIKMKGDVLEQLENLKEINEDAYHRVIAEVSDRYKQLKNVDPAELMALRESLVEHWQDIKSEVDATLKSSVKEAKKAVKDVKHSVKTLKKKG